MKLLEVSIISLETLYHHGWLLPISRDFSNFNLQIYFPDVEKVEWFNRILHQLWPSINIYFKDIISDVVAPSIRSSHSVLSTLKFTEMDLGKIAPQIIGIKVYKAEETSSDEIVMDLQLMWVHLIKFTSCDLNRPITCRYSSECNIEVNLNHLSAGVCDLILRGLIRVEMKPILNKSPFIGAIGISFVHDPVRWWRHQLIWWSSIDRCSTSIWQISATFLIFLESTLYFEDLSLRVLEIWWFILKSWSFLFFQM